MRRATTIAAALVLSMSIAVPVFAGQPIPDFLDSFTEQSYDGNDGSMEFNGPWIELGEENGPESGFVRVWDHEYCAGGYCLKMGGADKDAKNHGTYRALDLTGASYARLSFDDSVQILDDESKGTAVVQISSDGGDTWKTLDTINLDTDEGSVSLHKKYTITSFASRDTVIRFTIEEAENLNAYWIIDNVVVEATFDTPPTSTTTTTTTTPTASTSTTSTTKPAGTTTTTSTTKPTESTTTTHPREKEKRSPDGAKPPDETTTTTSRPETTTTTPRATTTTTVAPAPVDDAMPPADRETMMSKTALAVPAASGTNAMPASMTADSTSLGRHIEPVEAFAAAFLTESGDYGGNLLPSVLLGIVIAVVSLIGLGSRRES